MVGSPPAKPRNDFCNLKASLFELILPLLLIAKGFPFERGELSQVKSMPTCTKRAVTGFTSMVTLPNIPQVRFTTGSLCTRQGSTRGLVK